VNKVKDGHKQKQSYANTRTTGTEQYYTVSSVAEQCVEQMSNLVDLNNKIILEPAGGTGEFIESLKRVGVQDENIISYDIEPLHDLVNKADFLTVNTFPSDKMVCITNPPFGRMSSLAFKFFSHAADHCDYVGFLVPKSWRKWTSINRIPNNFHLVSDIDLPMDCFYRIGAESKKGVLNTIFQIWEKRDYQRKKIEIPDHGLIKKINPKNGVVKGANFSMVIFGHSVGRCESISGDIASKTTTMYLNIQKEEVKNAMKDIDFSCFANNVAYVQALSIQEINYKLNEYFELPNFEFDGELYAPA